MNRQLAGLVNPGRFFRVTLNPFRAPISRARKTARRAVIADKRQEAARQDAPSDDLD